MPFSSDKLTIDLPHTHIGLHTHRGLHTHTHTYRGLHTHRARVTTSFVGSGRELRNGFKKEEELRARRSEVYVINITI